MIYPFPFLIVSRSQLLVVYSLFGLGTSKVLLYLTEFLDGTPGLSESTPRWIGCENRLLICLILLNAMFGLVSIDLLNQTGRFYYRSICL